MGRKWIGDKVTGIPPVEKVVRKLKYNLTFGYKRLYVER
jgi:hypothetical protein